MCYFSETRSTWPVDTLTFPPSKVPIPKVNLEDFLQQAATNIVSILQDPPSTTKLGLKAGDERKNALLELSDILKQSDPLPKLPENTTNVIRKNKFKTFLNQYLKQQKKKQSNIDPP